MESSLPPSDLNALVNRYGVALEVLEDLQARRRAGARDGELRNLLRQPDRGALSDDDARVVVDQLPR